MIVMNTLLAIRKRLKVSQTELAAAIDVTQSAISQYELDVCVPSLSVARKLIKFAAESGVDLTLDSIYQVPSENPVGAQEA